MFSNLGALLHRALALVALSSVVYAQARTYNGTINAMTNPLWTVDAMDPSVTATTGFPVCIPRNTTDPECPVTNRPMDGSGNYETTFSAEMQKPTTAA
ncbi:hypothetical protein DFH09DRAFT_1363324 [Mycena vulgaris]|nr:hypothetical protein DFH09DRAFT_1363324 [Mycena vulgaris]